MASSSSVDQLGGAQQEPEQEQAEHDAKVKPDKTEQLEDRANAARRGRPDAKSVHSLEVADKQQSKVHHALVGAVNSTASGAQSQDGGVNDGMHYKGLKIQDMMDFVKAHPDAYRSGTKVAGGKLHAAMAGDKFVPDDAEQQRRLKRPLGQKRMRPKGDPERAIELWLDSGASENLAPLDAAEAATRMQQKVDLEKVATADANAEPLEVRMRGTLFGKCKVEKGHNKAVDLEFRGVNGLGKWLWSVPDLYRKGALVQFAEPGLGGSFIQLKNSEERIPIEFVDEKYFRVLIDIDDTVRLSYRQKQEVNFRTSCLAAGVSDRILAQTQRLGIARNFKFHTDVTHGADETSLLVNGQTPPAPKENQWRPHQVGALTYFDVAHIGTKWS